MCDFKPGDEVVRFKAFPPRIGVAFQEPPLGHVGRVAAMGFGYDGVWIELDNWPTDPTLALNPEEFRKVQRRDLSTWLATETTFEEPKRLHPEPAVDALFRRIMAGGDR